MFHIRRIKTVLSLVFVASFFLPFSQAQTNGAADYTAEQLAPGTHLELRQELLKRIQQARSEGIGIGGYMQALQGVETQVKNGGDSQSIGSRIESIQRSLEEQRQKKKILQTQKPIPPQGSQIAGSGSSSGSSSGSGSIAKGAGGGGQEVDKNSAIDMLKSRFGGNLDTINPDMLPASVREKLKDPETRKKLMEKFGHQ